MKQKTGFGQVGWRTLTIAACVQASACGGVSTDDRRDPDVLVVESDALSGDCGPSDAEPPAAASGVCAPALLEGYGYAEAPNLWPGLQSVGSLGIQGSGYFVGAMNGSEPLRFSREADVFVAPDGTLEDAAGRMLLGHAPEDVTCLMPLRAPATVPPVATHLVSLQMNLDAREPVVAFNAADPSGTSNTSVSFSIFDGIGQSRTIDIYFQRREPLRWGYHAFADGSDIEGGTPGEPVALGQGRLTFTSSGALESVLASDLCASFAGAESDQCLTLDFGQTIADGGDGLGGATSFAFFSAVMALAVDGYAAGTAAGVAVDPNGLASIFFDNGTAAPFGVLALARFPRERKLAETPDGTFVATPASGAEELGVPGQAGRGVLYYRELAVSP